MIIEDWHINTHGAYTLGNGVTLNTNATNPKEENKYDIPVGALVYVKTKNSLYNFGFFSSPNLVVPTYNHQTYPMTTMTTPKWVVNPTTTNVATYKGSYVTSSGHVEELEPYVIDEATGTKIGLDVDDNVMDSLEELQELYDAYVADHQSKCSKGRGSKGGQGLGMSTMGGNPKNKKPGFHVSKTKSVVNYPYAKPVKGMITTAGTGNNINCNYRPNKSWNNNLSSKYPELPQYELVGFKTLQDYFSGKGAVYVTQEDGLTEKELHEAYDESGSYPRIGKPFHGIVVDRFIPRITTEQGEVIDLPRSKRLYKVLVNENHCLWVDELELAPMKPEKCPLKKEFTETEETNEDTK